MPTLWSTGTRLTICWLCSADARPAPDKEDTNHWTSRTEINGAGKITAERDYWDTKELEDQLD